LRKLPRAIWALGFTSLLMDASSELVHALLPIYLATTLGASVAMIGLLEGTAEATSQISKLFSGWLSDRLGHRKWLAVAGYGLAAVTKPVFPLAHSIGAVFAARFVDRVGKGIRGAPRDALVADVCAPDMRGAAYGLRQSMDSVGAVIGPVAAIALMAVFSSQLKTVLWFAVVPAVLAVVVLMLGVEEPRRAPGAASVMAPRPPLRLTELHRLPRAFWSVVAIGVVFTLARFSEAFIVLRAADVGIATLWVPIAMVAMNVVYALASYPAGAASDRIGSRRLLVAGLAVLVVADAVFALVATPAGVLAGAGLWGLHMGLTQGLLSRIVADAAPEESRGSAFGVFNLATGLAMLVASALAGLLWTTSGARSTFLVGGAFALLAAGALTLRRPPAAAAG
jgi:MFS family permease